MIDNEQYNIKWHGGRYAVFNEYHSDPLFQGSHEECEEFLENIPRKKYALYEGVRNGDDFTRFIDAYTEEEAIRYAEGEWESMSKYDQERREYFEIAFVSPDTDDPDIPENDRTAIKSWV
ncbi:MAG: hypothetical protein HDQ98_16130 [Lachnospiraceae bacterium]|nr:hypothetical protein [Lachnospiraceae bacterium]MBD5533699.1 hypothetical protein [Lachnospiraceae bacterium]